METQSPQPPPCLNRTAAQISPIGEPIVSGGPFVMTTEGEVRRLPAAQRRRVREGTAEQVVRCRGNCAAKPSGAPPSTEGTSMTTRTLLACVCTLPFIAACGGEADAPQEGELGVSADEAVNDRASTEASGAEEAGPRTLGEGRPGGDATFENRDAASSFRRDMIPLEARGNEPGWRLDVYESTLELNYDYGEQTLTADSLETSEMQGGLRIAAPDQDLRVMVRDQRCTAASGMPYPFTVEVRLAERSFTGCGGETRKLLTGEAFDVTSINGEAVIGGDSPPTIRFTQADIGGSTGCNTYRAGYALTGETVDISAGESTQMACSDDMMSQEETFLSALESVSRLRIEGEGALMLEGDSAMIEARRGQ